MIAINIKKQAYQKISVNLDGKECEITLDDDGDNVYLSLSIGGNVVVANVICLNLVNIIRHKYLGLSGKLFFYDTQGESGPAWQQFGDRFELRYDNDL